MSQEARIIIHMSMKEFNLLLEAAKELPLKWSEDEDAVSLTLLPRVVFKLHEEPNEQQ